MRLSRRQGIEQKLKNEVEELKANSTEKETHITHLEVKVQGFTSSMEKAHKEAVTTFMKSNKFKNHLDRHYVAGYEDFRFDAKEAYPEMDFDSFKIPTAIESSLLLASTQDVNVMDNTLTELAQDATDATARTIQSIGVTPPVVYPSNLFSFLEKFIYFSLFESAHCFGLYLLKFI